MVKEIQSKGLQHIRNLKKFANDLHIESGHCPGMWYDCIEAALLHHRMSCLEQKQKNFKK